MAVSEMNYVDIGGGIELSPSAIYTYILNDGNGSGTSISYSTPLDADKHYIAVAVLYRTDDSSGTGKRYVAWYIENRTKTVIGSTTSYAYCDISINSSGIITFTSTRSAEPTRIILIQLD